MTRKEFESLLTRNARMWAKMGESQFYRCKVTVTPSGHYRLNDSGHAGTLEWLVSRLNESAPKFDSDDSPRWLLAEAVLMAAKAGKLSDVVKNTVYPRWRFGWGEKSGTCILMTMPAADLAAAAESVLPLPEWVTE